MNFGNLVVLTALTLVACSKNDPPLSASSAQTDPPAPAAIAKPVPPMAVQFPPSVSINSESAAIVDQLSYCGAISVVQSLWNRQTGNSDVASTLEHGAYAFGKSAVAYGQLHGFSEADVIQMNQANSAKVKGEVKGGFFFDKPSLDNKNENCLDLIKHTPGLIDIWKLHFNEST